MPCIVNLAESRAERSKLGLNRCDFVSIMYHFSSFHYKSVRCPYSKKYGEKSCPFCTDVDGHRGCVFDHSGDAMKGVYDIRNHHEIVSRWRASNR